MPESGFVPLTGGCNCGAVRFEISEPLLGAVYCHCTRCQRRTGTAVAPSAGAKPGTFRIVSGEDRVRRWNAGDGNDKAFCGTCGSALFSQDPQNPDLTFVAWDPSMVTPGCGPAVGYTSPAPLSGSPFRTMASPASPAVLESSPGEADQEDGTTRLSTPLLQCRRAGPRSPRCSLR